MIRHQIARILCALADRIEPQRSASVDVTLDRIVDLVNGHIGGNGVAGRRFEPGTGVEASY